MHFTSILENESNRQIHNVSRPEGKEKLEQEMRDFIDSNDENDPENKNFGEKIKSRVITTQKMFLEGKF